MLITQIIVEETWVILWTTDDKAFLKFIDREGPAYSAVSGQPALLSLHEMVLWGSLTLSQSHLDAQSFSTIERKPFLIKAILFMSCFQMDYQWQLSYKSFLNLIVSDNWSLFQNVHCMCQSPSIYVIHCGHLLVTCPFPHVTMQALASGVYSALLVFYLYLAKYARKSVS